MHKKMNWQPYLFIAPNMIGFIVFILFPVLFSLVISFTDFNLFSGFEKTNFIGLDNFLEMFTDEWFLSALRNNLLYTVVTIPLLIGFSVVLAVVLHRMVYGSKVMRVMLFLPYTSNVVAVSAAWMMLMNPSQGILNQLLRAMGIANPPAWLGSPHTALLSIMIVGVWSGLGYNAVIYLAGLQGVSNDYYEAARIDGANGWQSFWYITLPLLRNTTFFLTITNIISSFQVFGTVNIMTNGGPGTSTTVLAHYIYLAGFRYHRMGYSSSMAWVLLLIIFLVTLLKWNSQKKHEQDF